MFQYVSPFSPRGISGSAERRRVQRQHLDTTTQATQRKQQSDVVRASEAEPSIVARKKSTCARARGEPLRPSSYDDTHEGSISSPGKSKTVPSAEDLQAMPMGNCCHRISDCRCRRHRCRRAGIRIQSRGSAELLRARVRASLLTP